MEVAGGMCARHTGGQPGGAGGICAICLQEKLMLLWRGEGHFNWDTEEFSVTPPLESGSKTPAPVDVCEPRPPLAYRACFPLLFRARDDVRDESSKGLKREKIDRSCGSGLGCDDHQQQFSCEIKSIMRELAALHEKKKRLEQAAKKSKRPAHEHVSQGSGMRETDAAALVDVVPKGTGSILEEDDDEDAKDTKTTLCFNALWPAKLNMKWAKYLVSPILSSNKIAPSKSDLLAKIVNARPKAPTVEEDQEESETSGVEHDRTQIMQTFPAVALLPPRFVQRAAEGDAGAVLEIDKETAMRMEASRITVMTWLQSLPSPKAVHLKGENHSGLLDDLALGDGMLEMCDEEEVEVDCQSQEMNHAKFDHGVTEQVDLNSSHLISFGKFLRTPSHVYAPTRMVDIEIAAQ